MKTILWIVSLLLVICGCTPKPTEVVSPDGHIRLQFALDDHNRMTYRIDVDDTAFVAPSALGFLAGKGVNLSEGMKVVGTEFSAADETWTQPWGENKSIRNHYNEMAVCLSDEADTKLTFAFGYLTTESVSGTSMKLPEWTASLLRTNLPLSIWRRMEFPGLFLPTTKHMSCYIVHSRSARLITQTLR